VNARRPALQLASALLVYRWLRRVDAFLSKGWSTIAPQRQPSQPPSSLPTADARAALGSAFDRALAISTTSRHSAVGSAL